MKIFRTIRGRMMLCYSGIILLTILIMSTIYYRQASTLLENRASDSLLQLAAGDSAALDAAIESMDTTANRVVSSALIKDAFYRENTSTAEYLHNRSELFDLLFTVNGSQSDSQIRLFSTDGKFVEFGRAFDVTYQPRPPLEVCPWMKSCLEQNGKPYLVSPRRYEWDNSGRMVFSVCRAFSSDFGSAYDGVVEVQMDYSEFAQLVDHTALSNDIAVYVYNADGQCIHPLGGGLKDWTPPEESTNHGLLPLDRGNKTWMAAYYRSSYSGLTTVVTENRTDLLAPVRAFRLNLVVIGFLLLAVTLTITFILSNQLTEPIRSIQKSINSLQLADLHAPDQYHASSYELDKLGRSYTRMVERLQHSLEETIAARSHATEARMLALQSQMNPHFLYNTIAIISIKAEDDEDYEVVAMCECLTGMLRYVTRNISIHAMMQEELDYLEQYLYLMRCRYPNRFTSEIRIPDEMLELSVPRLILQPLVENSFKHGLQQSGIWSIALGGEIQDGIWRVTVSDNGVGFPDDTLERLRQRFAASTGDFQVVEAEHIGLANIFERLRFHYQEQAIFEIENLPGGGCRVTIGGAAGSAYKEV